METSATTATTTTECQQSAPSGAVVSEPRQLTADHVITFTSDLTDVIPVLPEELDLMRVYFGDLISAALTGDA